MCFFEICFFLSQAQPLRLEERERERERQEHKFQSNPRTSPRNINIRWRTKQSSYNNPTTITRTNWRVTWIPNKWPRPRFSTTRNSLGEKDQTHTITSTIQTIIQIIWLHPTHHRHTILPSYPLLFIRRRRQLTFELILVSARRGAELPNWSWKMPSLNSIESSHN